MSSLKPSWPTMHEYNNTQDGARQHWHALYFKPNSHAPPTRRLLSLVASRRAVWIESARQPDRCVLCLVCRSVSGGAVRPPDSLRLRTILSGGQSTPPHQTRQDCRACQSTAAAATQARQAATPSRPTAHTQRRCTMYTTQNVNTLWTAALYD